MKCLTYCRLKMNDRHGLKIDWRSKTDRELCGWMRILSHLERTDLVGLVEELISRLSLTPEKEDG